MTGRIGIILGKQNLGYGKFIFNLDKPESFYLNMKKIITLLLIMVGSNSFAQRISLDFNLTGSGRNVTAGYTIEFSKNEIGFGLGYNINSLTQPDDQNNVFYKRLYATKPLHHLNFDLFYQRNIFTNLDHFQPFVFVDIQVKYSTVRSSVYLPYAFDSSIVSNTPEEKILYRNYVFFYGPFLWIENYIGLGFNVDLHKSWFLKHKVGVGGYSLIGRDDTIISGNYSWEFAWMLSVGLGYTFKK